jgi:hypothetical protein
MINWTEEDVKFVVNTMINPVIELLIKRIDIESNGNMNIFNTVADQMQKLQNDVDKEIVFLKGVTRFICVNYLGMLDENYDQWYEKYCEEFDNLNKLKEEDKDE